MDNSTNYPIALRLNPELRRRIDAHKPAALSRNAWYAWLLERQIAFEERKATGTFKPSQSRPQQPAQPAAEPFEDHVIVYD